MDDRRFDSLTKALASGKSRRSVLKGLFGLGAAATVGSTLMESGSEAARRPTPTPKPITCPGNQTPVNGVCTCPASAPFECGPDCCTSESGGPPTPTHSECCDNACCFGTCYGEELCCPTNNRSAGEFPIPPTHKICTSIDNGTQCCELDQLCCSFDGCCDTVCWGDGAFCCPNDPVSFCPGGESVPDICCVNEGDQIFACCNGGTDARVCYDTSAEGACCTDADCGDPCQVCNSATNICEPRCDAETEVCCVDEQGAGSCQTGRCCLGEPCPNPGQLCCMVPEGSFCLNTEVCPDACDCPEGTTCCRESPTAPILCVIGETCACDNFCGPIETDANNGNYYCCTEPDYTICCDGPESECCGGPAGRQCQPNGHCCEATAPYYCSASEACCIVPCDDDGLCPEAQLCLPEGGTCPNAAGLQCCDGLGCCGGQCCASANCCADSTICCGPNCARCEADICVEDCRVGRCLCLEGQTCDQQTGRCVPDGGCEPNCLCGDGVVNPATDGRACNGGLAAGGGVCACGWCVVPIDGCPCGCAGNPECVRCAGNDICETYNQGGSCNGGAGVCEGEFCVDAPPSCADTGEFCEFSTDCCEGVCLNDECTLEAPLCAPTGQSCVTLACCEGVCSNNICTLFVPLCAVRGNSCASLECCNDDLCCTLAGDPGLTCHEPSECPPV